MVQAVREAALVLAPYRGATQSGTVLLAVTLGVPVVAYDVGAVSDHVPRGRLVPVGDHVALAGLVCEVLSAGPAATGAAQPAPAAVGAWRDRVADAWDEVLSP